MPEIPTACCSRAAPTSARSATSVSGTSSATATAKTVLRITTRAPRTAAALIVRGARPVNTATAGTTALPAIASTTSVNRRVGAREITVTLVSLSQTPAMTVLPGRFAAPFAILAAERDTPGRGGPMGETQIRPLTAADFEAVVALDARITGGARRGYFQRRLDAALRDPKRHLQLAAGASGGLRGFLLARRADGEFGEREPVAVLEAI